jgi:hypothetical protein
MWCILLEFIVRELTKGIRISTEYSCKKGNVDVEVSKDLCLMEFMAREFRLRGEAF